MLWYYIVNILTEEYLDIWAFEPLSYIWTDDEFGVFMVNDEELMLEAAHKIGDLAQVRIYED